MRVSALWFAAATATAVFAAACSDPPTVMSTEASGGVVPPSAGPNPETAAPAAPDCPPNQPVDGQSCFVSGQSCEYGVDVLSSCNERVTCFGGTFERVAPDPTCHNRCPGSFDAVAPGAACDDGSMACSYPEGTCGCVVDVGAGPDAGSNGDAGEAGAPPQTVGRWACVPPPSGACPRARPPIGSACVKPMRCDYGRCAFDKQNLELACEDRRWTIAAGTCPP